MRASNSRVPRATTRKRGVPPTLAYSDSPSETLKRRRSRLVSTRVANTAPVLTNSPVSTVRVLITPAIGARTSERARFWRAMAAAAFWASVAARRLAVSCLARVSSSAATSWLSASSSRRDRSAEARSASAAAWRYAASALSASSR
jgi:hypothetical protein